MTGNCSQKAGNAIIGTPDLKISRGRMPPYPPRTLRLHRSWCVSPTGVHKCHLIAPVCTSTCMYGRAQRTERMKRVCRHVVKVPTFPSLTAWRQLSRTWLTKTILGRKPLWIPFCTTLWYRIQMYCTIFLYSFAIYACAVFLQLHFLPYWWEKYTCRVK